MLITNNMVTNEELKDLLVETINAIKCIHELMPSDSAEFDEIKHYLKNHSQTLNSVLSNQTNPQRKMFHYYLVSSNGEKLFPNCIEDDIGYFSRYEYESIVELFPGDCIRVTDDNFGMGMAKIVGKIYNASYHSVYLICENMDPMIDYIYTPGYEKAVSEFVDRSTRTFKHGERPSSEAVGDIIEVLTKGRTTIDHWNVLQRTNEILEKKLEYNKNNSIKTE